MAVRTMRDVAINILEESEEWERAKANPER